MTTLKGVFPNLTTTRKKNFIQENMKNLRRMEQCFHPNKEVDDIHKFQINRHQKSTSKYSNVTAKVNTSLRGSIQTSRVENSNKATEITEKEPLRKISTPILNKKNPGSAKKPLNPLTNKLANKQKRRENVDAKNIPQGQRIKVTSDPNFVRKSEEDENSSPLSTVVKYRHQGIQTLEEKHIDQLYTEGVIRYPSKGITKNNDSQDKNESSKTMNGYSNSLDQGDMRTCVNMQTDDSKALELPEINEGIDIVKSNKDRNTVANKIAIQLNNGIVPPNYRKGVVPKYIKDRKEALQKEEEAKASALHPDCPEGHVPLPDNERQETLRMLKKNYQDYVNELNMMPIKTDTLRAQRRKMEIEKQLNKLEEGIKVFSRPKVYVKINA
ncbi:hypothetical protein KPH14_006094 [Odynerus spinipes]|uniref:Enkurin domain-containing protein n=1 Tax=Odynerus spinipes TaxID=1348599 RepID=A0AAD9RJZ6_9HYME|nr:hypothetical protein KPH14_006094 [Odynerus spinipes]